MRVVVEPVSIDVPTPFQSIVNVPPRCSVCCALVRGRRLARRCRRRRRRCCRSRRRRGAARQSPATHMRCFMRSLRSVSSSAVAMASSRRSSSACACSRWRFSDASIQPGRLGARSPRSAAISGHRSGLAVRWLAAAHESPSRRVAARARGARTRRARAAARARCRRRRRAPWRLRGRSPSRSAGERRLEALRRRSRTARCG